MTAVTVPTLPPFDWDAAAPLDRLAYLATALDDEQAWRNKLMDWEWSSLIKHGGYNCGSAGCALGLMWVLWSTRQKKTAPLTHNVEWIYRDEVAAEALGLDVDQLNAIFYGDHDDYGLGREPGDVARIIRIVLREDFDYAV
jgi:hypothetical protein